MLTGPMTRVTVGTVYVLTTDDLVTNRSLDCSAQVQSKTYPICKVIANSFRVIISNKIYKIAKSMDTLYLTVGGLRGMEGENTWKYAKLRAFLNLFFLRHYFLFQNCLVSRDCVRVVVTLFRERHFK